VIGDYDLANPDRFTVGTVGPVGERTFMLQCRQGPTLVTVKVEKQQVAVLASYLAGIVKELGRPGHLPEDLDLEPQPLWDWVAGTIGVRFDEEARRIVVVVEELVPEEEEGSVATIALTAEQAAAFAIHATSLVESGRPPCPLCDSPLDPSGHVCPRTNGYRPPT
jgi:uncharacterized repeat protein (TIGR03847 family)